MTTPKNIFRKIHWFNFPKLPSNLHSETDKSIKRVLQYINKTTPVILYMLNNSITDLHELVHDDVDYLNKVGIDIYLYEPLVSYYAGFHKKTPQFYHEFIGNEDVNLIRSIELDSISLYASKNNLTNITVHTCDYGVDKYYPYYKNLKLICDDVFVKTSITQSIIDDRKYKIERKFLSLNGRYATHRHMITSYLQAYPSFISWQFKCNFDTFSKNLWFDIDDYKFNCPDQYDRLKRGVLLLDNNSPMSLDYAMQPVKITEQHLSYPAVSNLMQMNYTNSSFKTINKISTFYNKSFISIVNETRFAQPTGNYSEKVLQAILFKHPFILVAPPHTLKYLRELGIKTFSDYWDESYDEEPINSDRMVKIFKLIEFIGNKSIAELEQLKTEIEPIVKYNSALLRNLLHNFNLSITKSQYK